MKIHETYIRYMKRSITSFEYNAILHKMRTELTLRTKEISYVNLMCTSPGLISYVNAID